MGTVIGACLGTLVVAVVLIVFGLWFYRRSARGLKGRPRGPKYPLSNSRNHQGEQARSRSRLETWDRLGEDDDKWEGRYQTEEVDHVGPMEKLTMFKKSPSVRTAEKSSSEGHHFDLGPVPFAQYHPELPDSDSKPQERPFLGRVDPVPPISWDGETLGNESFLSLRSPAVSTGAMSPTLDMAIPTPPAITSELHKWESAEVMHFEGESTKAEHDHTNPFADDATPRKSISNPFFNAQSPKGQSLDKGKRRAPNPFDDEPEPKVARHIPTDSVVSADGSAYSSERALQSLIAVLDVSPEEVHERLRVASLQASYISANSTYTAEGDGEEEDVTSSAFPLPPHGPLAKR